MTGLPGDSGAGFRKRADNHFMTVLVERSELEVYRCREKERDGRFVDKRK